MLITRIPGQPEVFDSCLVNKFEIATGSDQSEIIASAGYGYVHPNIEKACLVHTSGIRLMAIWHPNQILSYEEAVTGISCTTTIIRVRGRPYKARPATVLELAMYESYFHQKMGDMILVALGEKVRGGSRDCVTFRHASNSVRELLLWRWPNPWCLRVRYLIVLEAVS